MRLPLPRSASGFPHPVSHALALLALCPVNVSAESYFMGDALGGLAFDQPLAVVSAPGEKDRLFVVEKTGRIHAINGLGQDKPKKSLFLDLKKTRDGALETDSECGVLGLAFPEDHAKSRRCFVYYSLKIGGKLHQRVSRFTLSAGDSPQADLKSEQPLFTQADRASNHNGGDLHFGPDGYLYISTGDGGAFDDQLNQARFIDKGFQASILRIDVDSRAGSLPPNPHTAVARDAEGKAFYSVPADNPFVGATAWHGAKVDPGKVRTEIWATGLRNPWRFSFDPKSGDLFTGDVGQNLYEEINIITKGGDYGWSYREAEHRFTNGPGKSQEPDGFKPVTPVFEYPRATGISVTGGVVYRGAGFPQLEGAYVFADYGSGVVIALRRDGKEWKPETLARDPGIAGIGTDPRNGEILFANLGSGKIKLLQRSATSTQSPK